MIQLIDLEHSRTLDDYAAIAHLAGPVQALRAEAAMLVPPLRKRTVWMVNSTAQGGGVAEMLPQMVNLLTGLGLSTRWAVLGCPAGVLRPHQAAAQPDPRCWRSRAH